MSLKVLPWTAAPAPTPTVGETTARTGIHRAVLWFLAVYFPSIPIFTTSGAAYALCTALQYPTFSGCVRRDLWRLTTLTLWAAYMSLLALVSMHMRLFLPRAPDAVLTDLLDVGAARIGIPLAFLACLAASLGVTRVAIALDCVFVVLIAHRAPYAVLKDLLDVGVKRIGIATVLVFLSCLGLSFGVTWVAIALDCVYLVIIAHVLAIWVRLVRTYALRD
ncbi:hypothetical protein OsI_00580 [Oryza sativa Indica Group]|uniref:DUF7378 domain-containing protein n=1 Tax=Oryza sativa subsp. indica TaxID=39946 RepID=B8ADH2_ORYSI|nr:hypothetical protein OsI_00580 [Oryza sativa Indica Group]